MRITPKAILLCAGLVALPLAGATALVLPRYGHAVRAAESNVQLVVARETATMVENRVDRVIADAEVVAAAAAVAASSPGADALVAMRSSLASRATIELARIEVPAIGVATLLTKAGVDASHAPTSTAEARAEADQRGRSVRFVGGAEALVVVRVPTVVGASGAAPAAYITVPLHLAPIEADLANLVERRAFASSNVVVLDGDRTVIAAVGDWGLRAGGPGQTLAFYDAMPDGTPPGDLGIQFDDPRDGGIIASLVTVGRLGWIVGIARPQALAYENLRRLRRDLFAGAGAILVVGVLLAIGVARRLTQPLHALKRQMRTLARRAWSDVRAESTRSDEIGELDRGFVELARELERQESALETEAKHRADLGRFMSHELVERIVSGAHRLELGGERRPITVLFADVVAFTRIAESRPPEQVVALLNELFSVLTEVVFRHGGTVDKFIGDSIMAVWGAPVAQADHATKALYAAEDMIRFLDAATEGWRAKFDLEVRLAIGVNAGEAIVGNIGSSKRMEYTVIGDVVNVAARLESAARPNQILVGSGVRDLAGDAFVFRELGAQRLPGRSEDTLVFELEV